MYFCMYKWRVMIELDIEYGSFVWSQTKELENIKKHGVDFLFASRAFLDPARLIAVDEKHSLQEERFYCVGKVRTKDGSKVLTVRFTYRSHKVRIFGAGFWRVGRKLYEKENTK